MKPAPDRQAGYTIIEVMIFLVISSALVIGAFSLFSGRIQRTQFTQSVQAFDARLRTIANQAATGTYPEGQPFDCTISSNAPLTSTGVGTQGSRSDCIFLGKIISPASIPTCTAPLVNTTCSAVDVYSVVGRRVTGPSQIVPKDIKDPAGINGPTGVRPRVISSPDLTETLQLGYGTRITGIYQPTNIFPLQASGIGFFQSLNGSYTGNTLSSGSQGVETWVVRAASPPYSPITRQTMSDTVAAERLSHPTTPNQIYICFKSADNSQYASIQVNSLNGAVTTDMQIGGTLCQNGN